MKTTEHAAALARTTIFRGIAEENLKTLAALAEERHVAAGEVVFLSGEPARGLYLIVRGSVRAVRINPEGREQTIHVESEGGMLAEVAVFDGEGYPSTAIADNDAELLFLARQDVLAFLRRHPDAALHALRMMAAKLRRVSGLAERLALQDVGQRLASLLLEFAGYPGNALQDGDSFSLPLPHGQIASRLGSVREVVTRGLQRLVQQEVIAIHGHRVVVLRANRLRELAGEAVDTARR